MSTRSSHFRSVGKSYHQFKVTKITALPELQCVLRELIHEPSGAQVMHIENEDPENVFCLSFQTLPSSSNGVAHVLEHAVLCGSQKFPIKDPFFAMHRRSLNTFMNALTGADFTCYPAASEIRADFYNLLEVYLDAVFHPLLEESSFLQEGRRLEFSQLLDPSSSLEYKGVVYNEMKGALSSPNARLSEAIYAALFPDVTYGCNAGGDPREISQLSYGELKQFYHTFYHPARCLFFFYGNMPLEGHLDFIARHTLNHTTPVPSLPPIPLQPRFTVPLCRDLTYPTALEEDLSDKTWIAFAWLTCPITEQQDVLALNILEIILMETDASPLKMALLQSGLCRQANPFIDIELNEIPWGITLKGCRPESVEALEKIIKGTLRDICAVGISLPMIENAIHQLEFHRSEIGGDQAPFGLSLFIRSGLLKQHGVEPSIGLVIHSLCARLRQVALEDPDYFVRLLQKYVLDNPHYVRLVMRPDPLLGMKEIEEEKKGLAEIKDSLSQEEREAIIQQAVQLLELQKKQAEGNFEVLPKLFLHDIPPSAKDYPLVQEEIGELTVFHRRVFTNDIVYADLIFNFPYLPEEDLPYLRLFTTVLTQVGCCSRSYRENLEYIQGNTGGLGAGLSLNLKASDHFHFSPTFHLRGKALHRKAPKLFSLLHETIAEAHIDDLQRLKEIILKHFISLESAFNQSALKYAVNLSASSLSVASKVAHDLHGLNYYRKIQEIVKNFDGEGPYVLAKLQQIQEQVTCLEHPHLVLGCQGAAYNEYRSHHFYGLQEMATSSYQPWKGQYPLTHVPPQGLLIASPVAFIAKVFPTVSYTHPDAPALNIAAHLFDNLTLHAKIREQGGAYGGGAVSNPLAGNFYFYSYRDPNISATFRAFEESVQTVLKGNFDDSDLEEAKFEVIQA